MAGDGDKIVSYHLAERLRAAMPDSTLQIVAGAGHMVHHVATDQVVEAILAVTGTSDAPISSAAPLSTSRTLTDGANDAA